MGQGERGGRKKNRVGKRRENKSHEEGNNQKSVLSFYPLTLSYFSYETILYGLRSLARYTHSNVYALAPLIKRKVKRIPCSITAHDKRDKGFRQKESFARSALFVFSHIFISAAWSRVHQRSHTVAMSVTRYESCSYE